MVSKQFAETDRYGAGVDNAGVRHTPGPWESVASDPSEGFECYWIRATKPYGGPFRGSRIVEIGAVNGPQNSEQSANARLVAAAPDMVAEMLRYLPIIEAAERDPEMWGRLTAGTGIATANGYRTALSKATPQGGSHD